MVVRYVVFDLDGTLVDSAPDILAALRQAVSDAGIASERELSRELIGPPVREMLNVWGATFTPEQGDAAIRAFRRIYDSCGMQQTQAYSGAVQCVQALRSAKIRCFVATNKPEAPTRMLLDRFFIGNIDDICCVNSLPNRSLSKREMLEELAHRHGLARDGSVIIGDGESDLRAGTALGWRTIAALYGYGKKESLLREQPDWAVESPREIAQILLEIAPTSGANTCDAP